MHVYRYRSPSLLSQKGLLYDEWYFASKEELNDPVDLQSKYEFSGKGWKTLINRLWGENIFANQVAWYFSSLGPISYDEIVSYFGKHKSALDSLFLESTEAWKLSDVKIYKSCLDALEVLLKSYEPGGGYSISFSRNNSNMLMWSHYAGSHSGFCLIYRTIDGKLYQCPDRKKDSLTVAEGHHASISPGFTIKDVNYSNAVNPLDAFRLLPSGYGGEKFNSEDERLDWHKSATQQLLTKNVCWEYEEECRMLLLQPKKFVSGVNEYSSLQRLFHYDFDQLVGVIFGARMSSKDKAVIRDIIDMKRSSRYRKLGPEGKRVSFDFLYQQAEICQYSRDVKIVDHELYMFGTLVHKGTKQYIDRLEKWRKGHGITIENGEFSYGPIPF